MYTADQMTLFFVALLPPQDIQDYANEVKKDFAVRYRSRQAQKSPPHITLQPPFQWQEDKLPILEEYLKNFGKLRDSLLITLSDYGAFSPRVIYINVLQTPELLTLQGDLTMQMEEKFGIIDKWGKNRPFIPHMTVAFKDLTQQNFHAAWLEFEQHQLDIKFHADHLALLFYDGKQWNVKSNFPFTSHADVE